MGISRRVAFRLATSDAWERAVLALPGGQRTAFRFARRYVAGVRREDAFERVRRLAGDGLVASIDYFRKSTSDPVQAERVTTAYVELARELERLPPGTWLSLGLSHIGLDEAGETARGRLARIAEALPEGRRIQVGAEEARRADRVLRTVLAAARDGAPLTATVQANLKRSRADAAALAETGVPMRIVKGAYLEESEIAWPWGQPTDQAFAELARELHAAGASIVLATHDPILRERLLPALPGVGVEMLLGVRPADALELARRGLAVRIYVPYGEDWFRYAMRRWAESLGA